MSGNKIIEGAKEAVAVARGEQSAARITVQGHSYVPESELAALRERAKEQSDEADKYCKWWREERTRAETAERKLAEAIEVLKPFAEQAETHGDQIPDSMFIDDYEHDPSKPWRSLAGLTVGQLRRAARAITEE